MSTVQYYSLIAERDLVSLSDRINPAIDGWLGGWCAGDSQLKSLEVSNAYDVVNINVPDQYLYKLELSNGLYIHIFSDSGISYNLFAELTVDRPDENNGLILSIIQDALTELVVKLFQLKDTSVTSITVSKITSIDSDRIVKGDGAIVINIVLPESSMYILAPREVHKCGAEANQAHSRKKIVQHDLKGSIGHRVNTTLSVKFTKTKIKYRDLKDLSKNDILVLDHIVSDDLKVMADTKLLCGAELGVHNERIAVKLK